MYEFNLRKYVLEKISIFEIHIRDCCFLLLITLERIVRFKKLFAQIVFSTNSTLDTSKEVKISVIALIGD